MCVVFAWKGNVVMNQEQMRQKIAKQYKSRIQSLEEENRKYKRLYLAEQEKRIALESDLAAKDEWIERLLTFMDMSSEQVSRMRANEEVIRTVCEILGQFPSSLCAGFCSGEV